LKDFFETRFLVIHWNSFTSRIHWRHSRYSLICHDHS